MEQCRKNSTYKFWIAIPLQILNSGFQKIIKLYVILPWLWWVISPWSQCWSAGMARKLTGYVSSWENLERFEGLLSGKCLVSLSSSSLRNCVRSGTMIRGLCSVCRGECNLCHDAYTLIKIKGGHLFYKWIHAHIA
jgi:hypothetical protein